MSSREAEIAEIAQKTTPNLWCDTEADEAAHHCASLFEDSRVVRVLRCTEAGPGESGTVVAVQFELAGQRFVGINGGPLFRFTEAVSLEVRCAAQEEVDRLREQLGEGGEHGPCGWVADRCGLSWQVVPNRLHELITDPDEAKVARVTKAVLGTGKLEAAAG
ncbi:VOC family protein [Saccharopolyspora hordei]|uniref:Putative 3-demethylubiquinone-9 3-methyltransferase (Glyoxalase superfamily) n=1 Tax=Saccharopolyspora hordei TaxID=1838 RepID=A0A853AGA6_9PSEU|nr:putative 3-demethylubiquinone-9 3-methyltransferase (glyoxalase superfamily) [Saccharopolyspora hordei]